VADQIDLTIAVAATADSATVHCRGRLLLTSAGLLRQEVKPLIARLRHITIDFSDVTMMDSVGLGTIASLYVSAKTAGAELHLVNIRPRIRELFSVSRLLSLFESCGEANIRMP
jgi:anti-anti-sigma factor